MDSAGALGASTKKHIPFRGVACVWVGAVLGTRRIHFDWGLLIAAASDAVARAFPAAFGAVPAAVVETISYLPASCRLRWF